MRSNLSFPRSQYPYPRLTPLAVTKISPIHSRLYMKPVGQTKYRFTLQYKREKRERGSVYVMDWTQTTLCNYILCNSFIAQDNCIKCNACQLMHYCNETCQEKDSERHKPFCSLICLHPELKQNPVAAITLSLHLPTIMGQSKIGGVYMVDATGTSLLEWVSLRKFFMQSGIWLNPANNQVHFATKNLDQELEIISFQREWYNDKKQKQQKEEK